jgi:predicted protein tyrosine phosphatase
MITLSDAQWANAAIGCVEAEHLISLMSPAGMLQTPQTIVPANHLRLEVDDIENPVDGLICPTNAHIEQLLEFGDQLHDVVVHCSMGMSRSPAAVMILLAQKNPGRGSDIAELIFSKVPNVHPNRLILEIGDKLLGCDGGLLSSVRNVRRRTSACAPDYSGSLDGFESFAPNLKNWGAGLM